jgi:general secretion pathway protein G
MSRARRGRSRETAFTLLELIVVITIIGILGTIVTVKVIPILIHSKREVAEITVKRIVDAAKIVHVMKGRLPETIDEMVDARDEEGNPIGGLDEEPIDPWKHRYVYAVEDGRPVAICYGRDGIEGGEGEDADIRWPQPRS